jgi:hypothetical protein
MLASRGPSLLVWLSHRHTVLIPMMAGSSGRARARLLTASGFADSFASSSRRAPCGPACMSAPQAETQAFERRHASIGEVMRALHAHSDPVSVGIMSTLTRPRGTHIRNRAARKATAQRARQPRSALTGRGMASAWCRVCDGDLAMIHAKSPHPSCEPALPRTVASPRTHRRSIRGGTRSRW